MTASQLREMVKRRFPDSANNGDYMAGVLSSMLERTLKSLTSLHEYAAKENLDITSGAMNEAEGIIEDYSTKEEVEVKP